MKNSDMPAMPIGEEIWVDPTDTKHGTHFPLGLTKREHFAGLAMQGILASGDFSGVNSCPNGVKQMARESYLDEKAVAAADALLKELER